MFPVIEVSGTAFERGRAHGARARARVERSMHVAPGVPSKTEYRRVALAREAALSA